MARVKSRRRPVRPPVQVHRAGPRPSLLRLATGPAARTTYVVLGAVGLAALAVALVGPKRLQREVLKPLRGAIEPQAGKLWADSRQLREQIAELFRQATPSTRARLARSLQSWIGHFHAT
jgi:hypothetical protein